MRKFLFITILFFCTSWAFSQNYVRLNGKLQVTGHRLTNELGKPVLLKGISLFGLNYFPECNTFEGFKILRYIWNCGIIRVPIYPSDENNGLSFNLKPDYNKAWLDSIVKWTDKLDMYCLIDWHVLRPGNPNDKVYAGASQFWNDISLKYKNKRHLLYEICNEPNGRNVTWDTVALYANPIIKTIRKNDPNTVIIIGTPRWSQELENVDTSKIEDKRNIMYSFHFYSASHGGLYDQFVKQIHRIPVFATEWGVSEASGNGSTDFPTADKFLGAMERHIQGKDTVYISSCAFSFADKDESSALLKPGSCNKNLWNNTTPAGDYVKKRLLMKGR